jgi:hypothetical protein
LETTPAEIEKHLEEYELPTQALRDPKHSLVRKAQVQVTPEAAVFLPNGREVYHGRIDNWFVDFGKQRPAPTERELEECLEAVLHGRKVANAKTVAVGCYIQARSPNDE